MQLQQITPTPATPVPTLPTEAILWANGLTGTLGIAASSAAVITAVANRVAVGILQVNAQMIVNKICASIGVTSAGGNFVVGIYALSGTSLVKLAQAAFSTTTNGAFSVTIAPVTLLPTTMYFFVYSCDNTTAQTAVFTASQGILTTLANKNQIRYATSSQAMVAAVLPTPLLLSNLSATSVAIPTVLMET